MKVSTVEDLDLKYRSTTLGFQVVLLKERYDFSASQDILGKKIYIEVEV